jgi:hypothetical protein
MAVLRDARSGQSPKLAMDWCCSGLAEKRLRRPQEVSFPTQPDYGVTRSTMMFSRFSAGYFPTLILSGAILLVGCAAKQNSSAENGGDGGHGAGDSSSSGGSSTSSHASSGIGGSSDHASSSKAGGAGSSGGGPAGSSSSSSSSGGGSGGASGGQSSGGGPGGASSGGSSGATSSGSSGNSSANTCTQDSQCSNGHCVGNACVCWDANAKVCNGVCTDVKYNNNACGECGKVCPASAPRCDYGSCKCDSPPCAGGGGGAAGGNSSSSSANAGGAGAGGNSSAGGGAGASGGASSSSTSNGGTISVPPITNGSDGWASRYWDCCKPSCSWPENAGGKSPVPICSQDNAKMSDAKAQSACNGGGAYVCWDMAPWAVSDNVAYGFAAFNGVPCGTCYQIQFTGGTHNGKADSCKALGGKTMFVQVTNIGGIGQGQFDIMIPGGGVGDFDACTKQWGVSDLGARYGGFLSACNGDKSCVRDKCTTVFGSKPTLKAACNWFVDWYGGADNPALKYQKVNCPSELTAKSGM